MKAVFNSVDEAQVFVDELWTKGKYALGILPLDNGKIEVQYIEHKEYIAVDGKTFPDEVWMTKEGKMILVQDLSPDHLRNILRMKIRREREMTAALDLIGQGLAESADDLEGRDMFAAEAFSVSGDAFTVAEQPKRTLH
jgi:hypothetical protein